MAEVAAIPNLPPMPNYDLPTLLYKTITLMNRPPKINTLWTCSSPTNNNQKTAEENKDEGSSVDPRRK
jgi:hypothetical protein